MRNRWLDFLLTLVLRFAGGWVMGGIVGFVAHWRLFLMGSARGTLPWHLLTWWAIAGGVIMMFTVPAHNQPWGRR